MSEPKNYADFQQRRGAAMDAIDEAIEAYRSYMLDDDYNAQSALDSIINQLDKRRQSLAALPRQDGLRGASAAWALAAKELTTEANRHPFHSTTCDVLTLFAMAFRARAALAESEK